MSKRKRTVLAHSPTVQIWRAFRIFIRFTRRNVSLVHCVSLVATKLISKCFQQSCAYHDHLFIHGWQSVPVVAPPGPTVRCSVKLSMNSRASPSHRFRGARPIIPRAWIHTPGRGRHGSPLPSAHCARPAVPGKTHLFTWLFFALLAILEARGRPLPNAEGTAFGWVRCVRQVVAAGLRLGGRETDRRQRFPKLR